VTGRRPAVPAPAAARETTAPVVLTVECRASTRDGLLWSPLPLRIARSFPNCSESRTGQNSSCSRGKRCPGQACSAPIRSTRGRWRAGQHTRRGRQARQAGARPRGHGRVASADCRTRYGGDQV
jgi:hypothetical protein